MPAILCAIFFLSGASGLLFETLWFRQAGLTFGTSVWATSLVLCSFMFGLGLGNGLIARYGWRVRSPLRTYALLEIAIGAAGLHLVWTLPSCTLWLTPFLAPLRDQPWLLNPLRLIFAFVLLSIPATAMGATLPVLLKAMRTRDPSFGGSLGLLYGWNTLGAVVGAVAGEVALFSRLGITGSGAVAAGLNLLAAAGALLLTRRGEPPPRLSEIAAGLVRTPPGRRARLHLTAAALSGGALLAFEVVWFRFLRLFTYGASLLFSVMLAVVLAGIAFGGLAAGAWLRRRPRAFEQAAGVAMHAGASSVVAYAAFRGLDLLAAPTPAYEIGDVLVESIALMGPTSFLSGLLFTLLGAALAETVWPETRAAGLLTLFNTIGGAAGAFVATLALPALGMEACFFAIAACYGIVGLIIVAADVSKGEEPSFASSSIPASVLAGVTLAVSLILFPVGLMEEHYFQIPFRRYERDPGVKLVAVREGSVGTNLYARQDFLNVPIRYRLITDGYSMSGVSLGNLRYMKLYVYWPAALAPEPTKALLMSYGLGSTAKALTDLRGIESIDVVDVSSQILESSDLIYPEPADHPLRDPRAHVHVEDARYFMQASGERYDLITGEPPPPKMAGVVNLYTREFFELVYDRLADGGINTYWLPVGNLTEADTKSIVRAYCDVFPDCSLWAGWKYNWMLVGSRNAQWHRSEGRVERLWRDPIVGPDLRRLGFERPEQLGALFLADATTLRALTRDAAPLVDDFPKRLSAPRMRAGAAAETYASWMDTKQTTKRFSESDFIGRVFPEPLRERALAYFDYQRIINEVSLATLPPVGSRRHMETLDELLSRGSLRTLPLWYLGVDAILPPLVTSRLRGRDPDGATLPILARAALADRRFDQAAALFRDAAASVPPDPSAFYYRLFSLCLAGRREQAERIVSEDCPSLELSGADRGYWAWMHERFGLPDPYEAPCR